MPASTPAVATGRAFTITDLLACKVLSDIQIHPHGESLALVVAESTADTTPLPLSQIWTVDIKDGCAKALTSAGYSDLAPRWSPRGDKLAFLSDRDRSGSFEIYLVNLSDSVVESLGLASAPYSGPEGERGGISGVAGSLAWRGPGEIAFLAAPASSTTSPVASRNEAFVRLMIFELEAGGLRALTPPDLQVWEFAFSTDGQVAVVVSDAASEPSWRRGYLAILDPRGASSDFYIPGLMAGTEAISPEDRPRVEQVAHPDWAPDGSQLSLIVGVWSDRYIAGGDLLVLSADGKERRNLTHGMPLSVTWTEWLPDSRRIVATAWMEGEQALLLFDVATEAHEVLWRDKAAFSDRYLPRSCLASDGTQLFAVKESPYEAREVWSLEDIFGTRSWRKLSALQPQNRDVALARVDTVHWEAEDGQTIQGHLLLPPGKDTDEPLPMVTFIHGGPVFLHQYLYHGWVEGPYAVSMQLLCAAGLAVFLPNPRGSLGWGRSFAEALLFRMGETDMSDILSGVDYCVEQGFAAQDRLGIGGWSSAGFLAPWATTKTSRFKACFMGAGVSDWRTMHAGPSLEWTFDTFWIGGRPYDAGGPHDERSLLLNSGSVDTPTLIVAGAQDPLLPVGQAWAYYRALRDHGQAEVELVIYDDEPHAIRRRPNVEDLSDRVVSWFKRFLVTQA